MGIASGMLIAKARIDKGISAAELARRVGVSRGFISLLEKDATHISLEKIKKVAEVLHISLDELDFKDGEISEQSPEWLKYLTDRFELTGDDRRELLKITSRVGIPDNLPEETRNEFRVRWESFYQTVSIFLPNASTKMLRHPEVRPFLKCVDDSLDVSVTWDSVIAAFDKLVCEKIVDDQMVPNNGNDWLSFVCRKLNIYRKADCLHGDDNFSSQLDVVSARSFVQSSKRIYGVIIRDVDGASYRYIENEGVTLFDRGDFPIWHAAVRVLIDPNLSVKTGAYYYPDGEDRPPLEFVICRLASRFACWPFRDKWLEMQSDITPISVQSFIKSVYPRLPWRVAYVGLLDFCKEPFVYVDCYKRLKRQELKEKKIAMEDVAAMAKDDDAKLRVGFVFRNLAAEKTSFELRHNLSVCESSIIYKVFDANEKNVVTDIEDLTSWKVGYDLKGRGMVAAVRQIGSYQEPHVRAVIKILAEK